jgi:hypothetical protein
MIRFPERFHASETPNAKNIGVEPNYLEDERARRSRQVQHVPGPRHTPHFDFTALSAALK